MVEKAVQRISNRKFLLAHAPGYIRWLRETGLLQNRFAYLAKTFHDYLLDEVLEVVAKPCFCVKRAKSRVN